MSPVLTIDGPGGSGKGTVGQRLAKELGWHFLDSGAFYRLLGLAAARLRIPLDREQRLVELARSLRPQFHLAAEDEPVRVLWDGEDVSEALRSEASAQMASTLAVIPAVRQALLDGQRALRQTPGLVADGRDIGTVVFPDACLKIFLTASPERRAERRHNQLKRLGVDASLNAILQDMVERDARDRMRSVAPMQPAADAVVIDTSDMDIAQVCGRISRLLEQHLHRAR